MSVTGGVYEGPAGMVERPHEIALDSHARGRVICVRDLPCTRHSSRGAGGQALHQGRVHAL